MLAACYNFAANAALSPSVGDLVTRLRALLLSGLSAGLGAVAAGGLRLLDSRSSVAIVAGGSAVLAVALVVDAVGAARAPTRRALERIMADVAHVRERVVELEVALALYKSSADAVLRRDRGGSTSDPGRADRSGSMPAIDLPPPTKRER